jgi:hypothetical protein
MGPNATDNNFEEFYKPKGDIGLEYPKAGMEWAKAQIGHQIFEHFLCLKCGN